MKYALTLALALAATPAAAQSAPVYGPALPPDMPSHFSVAADESVDQAVRRVYAKRKCAKTWALVGAIGGTALDIVTTQINQRDGYRELNPIYGKRASVGEMLLFRGAFGAFNYWRITRAAREDPAGACKAAKITAGAAFLPGLVNAAVRVRF